MRSQRHRWPCRRLYRLYPAKRGVINPDNPPHEAARVMLDLVMPGLWN
jgi:hypothetical protein